MGRLNHYKKKLPPLRISSRAATVWKHCSSSTTHIDRRTLPTHSVSFFLSYRLSSLWDAAVVSPPDILVETLGPHAPITTVLPLTYSTPYYMLAFICNNIYNCHHRHIFLFLLYLSL